MTELFRPLTLWVMKDKSPEKLTSWVELFEPLVEVMYTGNIWEKIGIIVVYILVGIIGLALTLVVPIIFLIGLGLGSFGLDFPLLFG